MKGTAHVTSVEAVKDFRPAVAGFIEEAREALGMADMSMLRVVSWIEHDQRSYWRGQLRRRQKEVERARLELQQRQLSGTNDRRPDCIEQRNALRAARARLEEAEEKVAKVRHWAQAARRAVDEYRGQVQTFRSLVDEDPPRALRAMDHTIDALESYLGLAPPVTRQSTAGRRGPDSSVEPHEASPAGEEAVSQGDEASREEAPRASAARNECEPPR
jgi:hypothetical protein